MTDFQRNFTRAGHAHAGVLVTLALIWRVWLGVVSLGLGLLTT